MGITDSLAWEMLTKDERSALTLSLGHSKSTWEAGEIMGKSHYKYLEIAQRAKEFMKLFKNHLDKYGKLIPDNTLISPAFHDFIDFTIGKRKPIKLIPELVDVTEYRKRISREADIISEMLKLKSGNQAQVDLFHLIHEFDRWNNFRILPQSIQMPSPFKRRNKARFKKHLKNLHSLPEQSISILIEQLEYKGKKDRVFLTLITPNDPDNNYIVLPVKGNGSSISFVNKIGLFLFKTHAEAEEFGELITGYLGIGIKSCIDGQRFWPKFREQVRSAYNFLEIENIVPSKRTLSMAFTNTDKPKVIKILGKKRAKKEEGAKRAKKDNLW